jgi:hypothetical protein
MRTLVLLLIVVFAAPVAGQEITPAAEIGGGYAAIDDADETLHGWLGTLGVSVARWFSVIGEVSGNYYDERFEFLGGTARVEVRELGFMAGPRFSARTRRFTPWGQFLVGAARGTVNDFSETRFGLQPGGGLDLWISPRFGIRGGLDYRGIYFEEEWEGDSRVHLGLVIGLGER